MALKNVSLLNTIEPIGNTDKILWTINDSNFNIYKNQRSQIFTCCNLPWSLELENTEGHFRVYLILEFDKALRVNACGKISLCITKDNADIWLEAHEGYSTLYQNFVTPKGAPQCTGDFLKAELVHAKPLRFSCSITVKFIEELDLDFPDPTGPTLSKGLSILWESKEHSDIIFSVDGQDISAHKVILSSGSAVFAAMFAGNMQESITKSVKIEDIDYDTMEKLLYFLYTDEIADIDKFALPLFKAADKYAIENLKRLCAISLGKSLGLENALDILSLSDMHSCEHLKKVAMKYVNANKCKIFSLENWKVFEATHPDIVMEFNESE